MRSLRSHCPESVKLSKRQRKGRDVPQHFATHFSRKCRSCDPKKAGKEPIADRAHQISRCVRDQLGLTDVDVRVTEIIRCSEIRQLYATSRMLSMNFSELSGCAAFHLSFGLDLYMPFLWRVTEL